MKKFIDLYPSLMALSTIGVVIGSVMHVKHADYVLWAAIFIGFLALIGFSLYLIGFGRK